MNSPFFAAYEYSQLNELPSVLSYPRYFFPGAAMDGGMDGTQVKICPLDGQPWYGTFAFGDVTPNGHSGIFPTPDPRRLCVVAKGAGYMVSCDTPTDWGYVDCTPIMDVRISQSNEVLVFASYVDLVAYGRNGIKWRTKQLAWDGLKITEITEHLVIGEYFDMRSDGSAEFTVNLKTGVSSGGAEE